MKLTGTFDNMLPCVLYGAIKKDVGHVARMEEMKCAEEICTPKGTMALIGK